MRVHIQLDAELIAELDARAGRRRRSAFIAQLIRRALDDERRWLAVGDVHVDGGPGLVRGAVPPTREELGEQPVHVVPEHDGPW